MSRKKANARAQVEVKAKPEPKPAVESKPTVEPKPQIRVETKAQPRAEPRAQAKAEAPKAREVPPAEKVRQEWRSFQVWFEARQGEEEKKVQDMLSGAAAKGKGGARPAGKARSSVLPDSLAGLNVFDRLMVELVIAAREEWEARLAKAGLQAEAWTDMTAAEMQAVEETLGLPEEIELQLLGLPPQTDFQAETLSAHPFAANGHAAGAPAGTTPKQPSPLRQSTGMFDDWPGAKPQPRSTPTQPVRSAPGQNGRADANPSRRTDSGSSPAWATWGEGSPSKAAPWDTQPQHGTKPNGAAAAKPSAPFAEPSAPPADHSALSYVSPATVDASEMDQFDASSAHAREEAIRQFHAAAAEADIALAQKLYAKPVPAPDRARMLSEHRQAMERLARAAMQAQRAVCDAERERRARELKARDRAASKNPISSARFTSAERPPTPPRAHSFASAREDASTPVPSGAFRLAMQQEPVTSALDAVSGSQMRDKRKGKEGLEAGSRKASDEPARRARVGSFARATTTGRGSATPAPGEASKATASSSKKKATVSEELDPEAPNVPMPTKSTVPDKAPDTQGPSPPGPAKDYWSAAEPARPPTAISRASSGQPQTIPPNAWGADADEDADEDEDEDGGGGWAGIFQLGTSALAAPELLASLSSDSDSPLTSPRDAPWGAAPAPAPAGKAGPARAGARGGGAHATWTPAPRDGALGEGFMGLAMANIARAAGGGGELEDAMRMYVQAKRVVR
ncbi:hypothetical protein OBBRIDRAFT_415713 [Obba rivulosa]|uniref:Uncharacterized protein n=1 Tax=Obba rivulosa TaxID=1052685 RepID=A0A8E2APF7_9APHY|nr:hypothetical protein OBBRIDRAFT_415713 [Obba rivulosa]